ncbi:MAG: ABC transporter transmembrane domain-containing protein, partial [Verrucomicrobiota bacterium]
MSHLLSFRAVFVNRYKRYFPFLKPYRNIYFGGIVAGLIYSICTGFGLPTMMQTVFPAVFNPDSELSNLQLIGYASLLPAVFLLRGVSGYINQMVINFVGLQFMRQMREALFEHLQRLQLGFFGKYRSGELHARLTQDTQLVQTVITESANDLVRQPAILIGAFSWLIYQAFDNQNILFILLACVTVPLCVLPVRFIGRKVL